MGKYERNISKAIEEILGNILVGNSCVQLFDRLSRGTGSLDHFTHFQETESENIKDKYKIVYGHNTFYIIPKPISSSLSIFL